MLNGAGGCLCGSSDDTAGSVTHPGAVVDTWGSGQGAQASSERAMILVDIEEGRAYTVGIRPGGGRWASSDDTLASPADGHDGPTSRGRTPG